MFKHTLSEHARQFIQVKKIQRVHYECRHLGILFMRDISHAIDQTESEKLKKVELERGRFATITEVEDCKVFVVVILQQVSDNSKQVEQIDLQETRVDLPSNSLF